MVQIPFFGPEWPKNSISKPDLAISPGGIGRFFAQALKQSIFGPLGPKKWLSGQFHTKQKLFFFGFMPKKPLLDFGVPP